MTPSFSKQPVWDIFCRVIDNFGDIGVCWRLARQLSHEHAITVRLWVDELDALSMIWPEAVNTLQQQIAGVTVLKWHPENYPIFLQNPANVIIEAFACDIPELYHAHIQTLKTSAPAWINLDYLSAEAWVEDCHKMTSIDPSSGVRKTFFFPGFTSKTGGLLRESNITEEADNFEKNRYEWLEHLGVTPSFDALLISLFAYENTQVGSLLNAWRTSTRPIHCMVPQGRIMSSINQYLEEIGEEPLDFTHSTRVLNSLTLQILPFLKQDDYDKLLWCMDINFVRGEDSFVRAQWAGKPFLWHIYRQEENAHIIKLNAFLDHYLDQSESELATAISSLWLGWNHETSVSTEWSNIFARLPEWQKHTLAWREQLLTQSDLAQQLNNITRHEP